MSTPNGSVAALEAGLALLDPASRYTVALMQAAMVADMRLRGLPVDLSEPERLRHEWRRAVSELGPAAARAHVIEFLSSWAGNTDACALCAQPAHDNPLICPNTASAADA